VDRGDKRLNQQFTFEE
jgi:hypothetical protein